MKKYHINKGGLMKIGELAKKSGVTTHTLRYYDKEGLPVPSHESEAGQQQRYGKTRTNTNHEAIRSYDCRNQEKTRFARYPGRYY